MKGSLLSYVDPQAVLEIVPGNFGFFIIRLLVIVVSVARYTPKYILDFVVL